MALTPPAANNVSPLTEADTTAATGNYGITAVGPHTAGVPAGANETDSLVTKAYDLLAYGPLRDNLIFDRYATVRPTRQSHNGAIVQLNWMPDIDDTAASAELQETYDVLPTRLKSFSTSLTMKEYGRVVTTTALLRGWSMIPVDPVAAERIGRNSGSTVDRLALAALYAAGGINNDGTPGLVPNAVTPVAGAPSDTLRAVMQYFQEKDVEPFSNGLYAAVVSPASFTALRGDSDPAGWRYWQANNSNVGMDEIRRYRVQEYEGFEITTSNRLTTAKDIFLGADALAKVFPMTAGFSAMPTTVVSPVVDRLRRFASVGWYWLGGYGRFRAEAIATSNLAA